MSNLNQEEKSDIRHSLNDAPRSETLVSTTTQVGDHVWFKKETRYVDWIHSRKDAPCTGAHRNRHNIADRRQIPF